jgi:surface polysaccharide O-acyltransferase-like enzyme
VIAVLAIVWIHTLRSESLAPAITAGRFAVPFFVAAAVLLVVRSVTQNPTRDFLHYAKARTRRLLQPFFAWSIVYWCFKLAKQILLPQAPNDFPGWEALILGSAYHLWFLPFLWAVSLFSFAATKAVCRFKQEKLAATVSVTLAILVCLMPASQARFSWDGIWYMWLALPAVLGAFSLALVWVDFRQLFTGGSTQLFAAATFTLATVTLDHQTREPFAESLAGLSWLLLAISTPSSGPLDRLRRIAPVVFGIYLAHLLILKIAESAADELRIPIGPASDVVIFLVTALGTGCLAWAMSRHRYLRWMI